MGLLLLMASLIFACGPHYPNSYLTSGDDILTEMPEFSFSKEIERIQLDDPVKFAAVHDMETSQADIQELTEALKQKDYESERIEKIISAYRAVRETLDLYKQTDRKILLSIDKIPQEVPKEFSLYLRGAAYYQAGKYANAMNAWMKVLRLPADQRQYRSVWATYMLGNCAKLHRPHIAPLCYQRTRQLALKGFRDALGLAAASYGQEAAVYLKQKQYDKAIDLYLRQEQTGHGSAVPSLWLVCGDIFKQCEPRVLDKLIRHPNASGVLMAYALSFNRVSDSFCPQQILVNSVEQAGLETVSGADRMAMIAYQTGDFEKTRRWLNVADMDSLLSRRVRAKMLLRDGQIEAASSDLAFIARQTDPYNTLIRYSGYNPYDSPYKVYSELGSLYVSRKMYTQAIDALMRGGNWIDTAYLAERVLTLEELMVYVDNNWPPSMLEPISDEDGFGPEREKTQTIRYLLARRLSRHGQYEDARPYYPTTPKWLLEDFDTLTRALEKANDESVAQADRADAFWTAAWITRHKGMELLGFESSPDWTMFNGSYRLTDPLEYRKKYVKSETNSDVAVFEVASKHDLHNHQFNRATPDEIQRAEREVAIPDKRFHYRYMASDFAWEAAALMENEDVELARRLCLAGIWHRDRDNKHADVFYKSLVLRCGTTGLGKAADKLRWFPKIPDTLKAEAVVEAPQENEETLPAADIDLTGALFNPFPEIVLIKNN